MDNIKKYLQDNDERLTIEKTSDDVWLKVQQGIKPKWFILYKNRIKNEIQTFINFFIPKNFLKERKDLFSKTSYKRTRYNIKFAFGVIVPIVLFFSCTYRVNRVEVIGNIISFDIVKDNIQAFQRITFLENFYGFSSIHLNKADDNLISFLSFIQQEKGENKKIEEEIKQIPFVYSLKVIPVHTKINESLLSAFTHKVFNIHIDERRPERREMQKVIQNYINALGFNYVKVTLAKHDMNLNLDSILYTSSLSEQNSIISTPDSSSTFPSIDTTNVVKKLDTIKYSRKNEVIKERTVSESGKWIGKLKGDFLSIRFFEPKPDKSESSGWIYEYQFKLSDIGITTLSAYKKTQGNFQLDITREAGTAHFKIVILNTNSQGEQIIQDAVGSYVLEENRFFKEYVRNNGFDKVDTELMLLFFLTNIDKEGIKELKQKGYTKPSAELNEFLKSKL